MLALLFLWIYRTIVHRWDTDSDVSVAVIISRLKIEPLQIHCHPGVKTAWQAKTKGNTASSALESLLKFSRRIDERSISMASMMRRTKETEVKADCSGEIISALIPQSPRYTRNQHPGVAPMS